jgi:flagellar hook-associated protein 3 FlgL
MRVSSSYKYEVGVASLYDIESERMKYYEQTSTGLRVNRPSDDPLAASQSVTVTQSQNLNTQYEENRSVADEKLEYSETTVDSSIDTMNDINSRLIQANSGSNSEEDYKTLATDLRSYYSSLVTQANSTDGQGNYIYSGNQGDTAPYEVGEDGFVTDEGYQGDDGEQLIQVDKTRQLSTNDTADDMYGTIFEDLEEVILALESYDGGDTTELNAAIDKAQNSVSETQDSLNNVKTTIGARRNEISSLDDLGASRDLSYSEQLSDLVDADTVEASSMLSYYETQYEASLLAFQKIQSLNLFGNS